MPDFSKLDIETVRNAIMSVKGETASTSYNLLVKIVAATAVEGYTAGSWE